MNQVDIKPHEWSIVEEGFDKDSVKASESLFALGNGAMGGRGNFEEKYSGESLPGSYIAGIYYPDKTKVGWWKVGYPEHFAKVLNAPNWIGIDVKINGEELDLNKIKVSNFRRELNMKEGCLKRSFKAEMSDGNEAYVKVIRFLSMKWDELGVIRYEIIAEDSETEIEFLPYVDSHVKNEDANWDELFWEPIKSGHKREFAFVKARTRKTGFQAVTFMKTALEYEGRNLPEEAVVVKQSNSKVQSSYRIRLAKSETAALVKYGGYVVSTRHKPAHLESAAKTLADKAFEAGYDKLLQMQKDEWAKIWETADIQIEGDVSAQQGVRYNTFQLYQTWTGKDGRLNIGPKGFTGEKYGGSTYWDTEAFCFPFYLTSMEAETVQQLLDYRHRHLDKAIENAKKLGVGNGAALYPMVTMTGEESHNEWEITFQEIHRNGAIAFAIYNYVRYTGDYKYLLDKGFDVLIAIARYWYQRVNFSKLKNKYVILGVTGPNEYENNVNNNFYTNYIAKWCLDYTGKALRIFKNRDPEAYDQLVERTGLGAIEADQWRTVSRNMYLPYSEEMGIYIQQDGFLDKKIETVEELSPSDRPLNKNWSWDRILRSPYIKQADVLQTFYFFGDRFKKTEKEQHFEFYEPLTVHESSLSPAVHGVLAARLGKMDKAYKYFMQSARMDLDDLNKEVEEGLHITSMAGSRLCISEGFAGMSIREGQLNFEPRLPEEWESFSFKINFRGRLLKIKISHGENGFQLEKGDPLKIWVDGVKFMVI